MALHALVQATMIYGLRSDLRQVLLRPRLAENRSRRPGHLQIIRQRLSNSGSQSHSAWRSMGTGSRQVRHGTQPEPSFTCEPLPCGLIFHGPAQKLLRFTEFLAWPLHRLRPGSPSRPLGGKKT